MFLFGHKQKHWIKWNFDLIMLQQQQQQQQQRENRTVQVELRLLPLLISSLNTPGLHFKSKW